MATLSKTEEKPTAWPAEEYRFFAAIRNDDLEQVKLLAAQDANNINAVAPKYPLDTRGMSPLQVALCTGLHKNIACYLLEHGADVNYCAERKLCDEAHPVLFDGICAAIWNARRYEWDGKNIENLVWKHTKEESDEAFSFLRRMMEMGADVNRTDYCGRNALMEAVSEANKLCPNRNPETGADYPGHPITPEMREDFRRIFQLFIEAGADRNNRSCFSGMTIRQHYEEEPVWRICGDLFD